MRVFILINLLLVVSSVSFGQKEGKKYLRKNKEPELVQYVNSKIYARGLYVDSQRILVGNSDGSLYLINISSKKSQLLFKLEDFTEMRDVEKCGNSYWGIQSGDNGKLVRIDNSGATKVLHPDEWKGRFFDGLDFYNSTGFLMGDPVDSIFTLYHTTDAGKTWEKCSGEVRAYKGEAGFAGSGTNVQILNDSTYIFITGGEKSRFIKSTDNGKTWNDVIVPYYPGESIGAYSVCFANDSIGVIVGGDWSSPELHNNTSFYTYDSGLTWMNSKEPTNGYRSCAYYFEGVFYSCGSTGIDFSTDNGITWDTFAEGNYFTLGSNGKKLIATTINGSIAFFDLIETK